MRTHKWKILKLDKLPKDFFTDGKYKIQVKDNNYADLWIDSVNIIHLRYKIINNIVNHGRIYRIRGNKWAIKTTT